MNNIQYTTIDDRKFAVITNHGVVKLLAVSSAGKVYGFRILPDGKKEPILDMDKRKFCEGNADGIYILMRIDPVLRRTPVINLN